MEHLGNAMLSAVTAAIIAGVLGSIVQEKSGIGILFRMISGLFLAIHIISPFTRLDFDAITAFSENYTDLGSEAAAMGVEMAAEAKRAIIKAETEAYILDKAKSLGVSLEVEIELTQEEIPVLESIRLRGNISPYAKIKMQQMMESDLGVPKEKQVWTD